MCCSQIVSQKIEQIYGLVSTVALKAILRYDLHRLLSVQYQGVEEFSSSETMAFKHALRLIFTKLIKQSLSSPKHMEACLAKALHVCRVVKPKNDSGTFDTRFVGAKTECICGIAMTWSMLALPVQSFENGTCSSRTYNIYCVGKYLIIITVQEQK